MPEITIGSRVYFDRQTKGVPYICEWLVERFEDHSGPVTAIVHVIRMRLKHSENGEFDLTADYSTERKVRWLRLKP